MEYVGMINVPCTIKIVVESCMIEVVSVENGLCIFSGKNISKGV
jgi:hypothetical protein